MLTYFLNTTLFFKAIKQNLKLKSFLGRSRNAIQTQIWIALIAYLLVSFAKHMAQEGWSVQRLLRIIQVNLFERKPLKALFLPDKKWNKQEEPHRGSCEIYGTAVAFQLLLFLNLFNATRIKTIATPYLWE